MFLRATLCARVQLTYLCQRKSAATFVAAAVAAAAGRRMRKPVVRIEEE
jgi:hypothetical protein